MKKVIITFEYSISEKDFNDKAHKQYLKDVVKSDEHELDEEYKHLSIKDMKVKVRVN